MSVGSIHLDARHWPLVILVSAIYLIQPPVAPTATFATFDEAYDWLQATFAEEQLTLPPRSALAL